MTLAAPPPLSAILTVNLLVLPPAAKRIALHCGKVIIGKGFVDVATTLPFLIQQKAKKQSEEIQFSTFSLLLSVSELTTVFIRGNFFELVLILSSFVVLPKRGRKRIQECNDAELRLYHNRDDIVSIAS